jgi:hypothetical protein
LDGLSDLLIGYGKFMKRLLFLTVSLFLLSVNASSLAMNYAGTDEPCPYELGPNVDSTCKCLHGYNNTENYTEACVPNGTDFSSIVTNNQSTDSNWMEKPLSLKWRTTLWIIFGIFLFIRLIVFLIDSYAEGRPDREWRRKQRKKAEEIRKKELELQREQEEQHYKELKEAQTIAYLQLRKEIEAMPQYNHWRQEVFKKLGRKCAVCSVTEGLEIDHRYESFGAIVRKHKITNIVQAYECQALWDVNNGAPLCPIHHSQTKTSIYYKANNPK